MPSMSSPYQPQSFSEGPPDADDTEDALLDPADAAEEIVNNGDADHPMDSDPEDVDDQPQEAVQLQNDSVAHFDSHTDSIYTIAQHPKISSIVATGGGDDTTYVWSIIPPSTPLPISYESAPSPERASLPPVAKLTGHTDSINALAFTLPSGDYLVSGGLDGKIRVHSTKNSFYSFLAEVQEVPEINFLVPCPHSSYPNTIALGASDGSVWVYTIEASDKASPLQVLQAYYLHTQSCTAGAWTPDGKMLATVSEEGSLYVWDPFGEAAAAGVKGSAGSQAIVGLTVEDQRFAVEGGLYSVAIAPGGAYVVVAGAGGMIRVVGLPRLGAVAGTTQGMRGGGAKNKSGGGKQAGSAEGASNGQTGQILASLQAQSDGVETLSFSAPPLTLLAAGSVDGSIVLFDTAHRFAVRRHIREAHDDFTVVKVEFMLGDKGHALTSCGMDGVVRRWDTRGGTVAGAQGLLEEWRGHRGDGEGGGVLGFVQKIDSVVTAGDDGVALVFQPIA